MSKALNIFESLVITQHSACIYDLFNRYNKGYYRNIFKDKSVNEAFSMLTFVGEVDNSNLEFKDIPISFKIKIKIKNKTYQSTGVANKLNDDLYLITYSHADKISSFVISTSELIHTINTRDISVTEVIF